MSSELKILTWNCNGALRKKFEAISVVNADICIIQECEDPENTASLIYRDWGKNFLWIGKNKHRGLGIFAREGIEIKDLKWETNGLKYFIACCVNDDFNLLAVWCQAVHSSFDYIGQLWQYLQINKSKLGKSIIAGDFNSNVIWDKRSRWWNHSNVVKELAELKIESFYHRFYNEEQGKETNPTFYLQRNRNKPYHIDYIFGSSDFSTSFKSLTVGSAEEWLTLSDHMPVIITSNE